MLKNTLILALLLACTLIVGRMEGQAFDYCKTQTVVSYETCLASHNIK